MKSTPAYILRNVALWLKEDVKIGQASEMTIPPIKVKMEKMRNAGMVMERDVPMGYEREPAKFKMPTLDPHSISAINGMPGGDDTLLITGALADEDGTVHSFRCYMRGVVKEVDFGNFKPGEKSETDYTFSWEYLKIEIDGDEIVEADDFDVSIAGDSQTGGLREALGLS